MDAEAAKRPCRSLRIILQPAIFLQGRIEVLLTHQLSTDPNEWECLVRPGRKIGVGERLFFGEQRELEAEVIARAGFGERRIRFAPVPDFPARIDRLGHVPLPPYISREDDASDFERYQTVYARERGSVAAPTAGLHFTPEILERLKGRGIETAEITLHVGLGHLSTCSSGKSRRPQTSPRAIPCPRKSSGPNQPCTK